MTMPLENISLKFGYDRNDEVVLGIYLHKADTGLKERALMKVHSYAVLPPGRITRLENEVYIPQGWQLVMRYETGPVGFRPWKSGKVFPEVDIEIAKPNVIKGRDRAAAGLRAIKDKTTPRIRYPLCHAGRSYSNAMAA